MLLKQIELGAHVKGVVRDLEDMSSDTTETGKVETVGPIQWLGDGPSMRVLCMKVTCLKVHVTKPIRTAHVNCVFIFLNG